VIGTNLVFYIPAEKTDNINCAEKIHSATYKTLGRGVFFIRRTLPALILKVLMNTFVLFPAGQVINSYLVGICILKGHDSEAAEL